MSEIYIHYGSLEDTIAQSAKVRGEISDYISEIKTRVTTPIGKLPGQDPSGYASTASSLAWKKISQLNAKATEFSTYESTISSFISTARTKDNYVSGQIESIADMHLAERNWFQRAGDAIYNFFCVDLANKWGWTKTISDVVAWAREKINDPITWVRDWFKYGDGKYVANIIGAAVAVVLAVASVIAAVVALPVVGAVVGVISVVAAVVSLTITVINLFPAVGSNIKALTLSDEHPGAARYYGNIKSINNYWHKTDMGGKTANKIFETAGNVIDFVKFAADVTQFVCNIVNLGRVRDFRFTANESQGFTGKYDFSFNNIKRNILHDMNIFTSKLGKDGVKWHETINWKKALDWDAWFSGYSSGKFKSDGVLQIPEKLFTFFKVVKAFDNTNQTFEHFSDIRDAFSTGEVSFTDVISQISDLSSVFSPVEKPAGYVDDTVDTVKDLWDWFDAAFEDSETADEATMRQWFDDAFGTVTLEPTPIPVPAAGGGGTGAFGGAAPGGTGGGSRGGWSGIPGSGGGGSR